MSFVYDLTIDPDAENNTHTFALAMIGHNKTVLEVGCATGYFTKVLAERGCAVIGMEISADAAQQAEQWAERVVVGDIDEEAPWGQIEDGSMDAITFGDVLEHLHDPLGVASGGPEIEAEWVRRDVTPKNIAHGDVRLSLLHGSFRYRDIGLLDRTHLRFFTVETVRELLREAGLAVVDTKRVIVPLFATEFDLKKEDYSDAVVEEIRANPEYETYQFVMKSVIDDGDSAVAEMAERLEAESDRANVLAEQNRALKLSMDAQQERMAAMAEERAQLGELLAWRDHAAELDGRRVKQLEGQLEATTARADEYGATAHRLHLQLEESERRYNVIRHSLSMRATAPLRRLRAIIRGR